MVNIKEHIEPNVNIHLEGDSWCNTESSWNILNMNTNKLIFNNDKKFYCRNEIINLKLKLEKGQYLLILKDNYGDGGIKGDIKYIENNNIIKNFNFSSGTYTSIVFNIDPDNILPNKTQIKIECFGDYYGVSESKWNIIDSLGQNIFNKDIEFTKSNDKIIKYLNLDSGIYYFNCIDTYGDGGIDCKITNNSNNNTLLEFNWSNLNWETENGYNKRFKFTI